MNPTCRNSEARRLLTGSFLLLVAALMMPVSVSHANLIPGPSFEKGLTKCLDPASSIDSTVARTGSKSLKLKNDGSSKNHNAGQYGIGGVQAGTEYVYSVWVRGTKVTGVGGGGKPLAVIRFLDAAGNKLEKERFMWAPYGTYGWQQMKIHLQAPAKAAKVDVSFRSWYDCLTGYTNWDDMSLTPRNLSYRGNLSGTYQAEQATSKSGGTIKAHEPGYTGSGYFNATASGAFLEWTNVSGGTTGGKRVLAFRYAYEGAPQNWEVFVNGKSQGVARPEATGRLQSWASFDRDVTLSPGNNTVRVKVLRVSGGELIRPNIDKMDVFGGSGSGTSTSTNTGTNTNTNTNTGTNTNTNTNTGTNTNTNTGTNTNTNTNTGTNTSTSTGGQQPYGGKPWPVPGTIQAENYDTGGKAVAYNDLSTGNGGGKYRKDDVDIWQSGSGYYTGANMTGEWLEYTVNVAAAGTYSLDFYVATPNSGCKLRVLLDGADVSGSVSVPSTGSWHKWDTVMATVKLSAGKHVLRVVFDRGGLNVDWMEISPIGSTGGATTGGGSTSSGVTGNQTPYSGTPIRLPGTIEAESYDNGGPGVAYQDRSAGNAGKKLRTDDVDIWQSSAGYYTGSNATGEWLEYTVNVAYAGNFKLNFRVATPNDGRKLRVEMDGKDVTGTVNLPNTGSWNAWQTVTANANLSAGKHVLRVVVLQGGLNFNWIDVF